MKTWIGAIVIAVFAIASPLTAQKPQVSIVLPEAAGLTRPLVTVIGEA